MWTGTQEDIQSTHIAYYSAKIDILIYMKPFASKN